MATKNHPAVFILPRWIEVTNLLRMGAEFNHQENILSIETIWGKIEALLIENP
jgi:hypothetical protein